MGRDRSQPQTFLPPDLFLLPCLLSARNCTQSHPPFIGCHQPLFSPGWLTRCWLCCYYSFSQFMLCLNFCNSSKVDFWGEASFHAIQYLTRRRNVFLFYHDFSCLVYIKGRSQNPPNKSAPFSQGVLRSMEWHTMKCFPGRELLSSL